jgi:capsular polysaccharide biosynthesis protein
MVSDGERPAAESRGARDGSAKHVPVLGGFTTGEPPGEEYSVGFPRLRFIMAALRRGIWIWSVTGAVGLVIGLGLYVTHPSYQASTSVVLVPNPAELPTDAILTDIALAQSQAVAGRAMHQLGLQDSVSGFLGSYKVTAVTDRVLQITLSAPSSSDAVARARAVAAAFLQFRAQQAETQLQQQLTALRQQVTQAKQQIATMTKQISELEALPPSPAKRTKLTALRDQLSQAQAEFPSVEQTVTANEVSLKSSTNQLVRSSQVLDPATPDSPKMVRHVLTYVGGGLIGGLVIGMVLVIIRALLSGELRRRDDVAHALGAPVHVSVGKVNRGRRGSAAPALEDLEPDLKRVVTHLERQVRPSSGGLATLALVPVDDPQVAALSLVSLALSFAEKGLRVVLADLVEGSPAARLLGVSEPGVQLVQMDDIYLAVTVPERGDAVPLGPLDRKRRRDHASEQLNSACSSANLLLTLTALDPSLGGEHLSTWATGAVVMVTAGQSSWAKIHGVGEMVRLAGTTLMSGVLVGADKADESLGAAHIPAAPAAADSGPKASSR